MALAGAVNATDHELRTKELVIALTPSANYVAGGDTVNLAALTNPNFSTNALIGFPGKVSQYEVIGAPVGYGAKLIPGATLATWKLKVLQGGAAVSSPGAEIPAGAYPAGVLADVFTIRLKGPKLRF